MLVAQEVQNAVSGDSSLLALAVAAFTLVGVVFDKVFAFLKGRGGPTVDENARVIADIRAENARLSAELKARLDGFERGSREVRDIVIATKTIVDRLRNT